MPLFLVVSLVLCPRSALISDKEPRHRSKLIGSIVYRKAAAKTRFEFIPWNALLGGLQDLCHNLWKWKSFLSSSDRLITLYGTKPHLTPTVNISC